MRESIRKFIGFDLDGVIVDHARQKMRLAKKFGFKLKPEETPSESIKQILPPEILRKIELALYEDPKIALLAPLMAGAKSGIAKIKKTGLPFVLISRRRNSEIAIKLLKAHGLWPVYFNNRNAFFVINPEDKNVKAREIGITHYIDDEMNILEKLADVKNKCLFDRHNVCLGKIPYHRINSWRQLLDFIEK